MTRIVIGAMLGAALVAAWFGLGGQASAHHSQTSYAQVAGNWSLHGGSLYISPAGIGNLHFRTYVNCRPNLQTACDRIIKNGIYPGGFIHFTLQSAQGSKATGIITNSSASYQVDLTISVTRKGNDTVSFSTPGQSGRACGPHAPPGYCGA